MSTTPPDDDGPQPDLGADELYLFADEPDPAARPRAPVPEPTPERKRRRRDDEEPDEEPPEQPKGEVGDRILNRPDAETEKTWWVVPVAVLAVGVVLCVVAIGIVAAAVGAKAAVWTVLGLVVAVVVQVAGVTALMMTLGHVFGIDYGPAKEAALKLVAVVVLVDGLTGVLVYCHICALGVAVVIGAGVFQSLFRLTMYELLISVAAVVGASFVLNAAVFVIVLKKELDGKSSAVPPAYALVSRSELRITETLLRLMAAAAHTGDRTGPPSGTRAPAATGIASTL